MSAAVIFQNMPVLEPEDYKALEASILANGVQVPVVVDENGVIIDGHHRSVIAEAHGLTCPKTVLRGKSDAEKRTLALSLNLDRRHLNREQRRALIAESVKADPQLSDREHARRTGASDKTVGTVRRDLVATAEIPQSDTRVSADGRVRPATQPERPVPTFDPTPSWDPAGAEQETGTDQNRPQPEEGVPARPRRRPLPDQFADAAYDFRKAVERLDRLVGDDRFRTNKKQVALSHKNDLLQLADVLSHVLRELD